jgi:hypothetical protein
MPPTVVLKPNELQGRGGSEETTMPCICARVAALAQALDLTA